MRKPQKNILQSLGATSAVSYWHGEISLKRAIQAAVVAGLAGLAIGHFNADHSTDLLQAQTAPGSLTFHDAGISRISNINLTVDTRQGVTGYFQRDTYALDGEFRKALENEINTVIAQAEVAGSWDIYMAARLTLLYMSEDPFERQVGNATLTYIQSNQHAAAGELPRASYYTRVKATEIEADRQIFAMADQMAEALRNGGKTPITRRAAENALLSFCHDPDRLLAAFNVAKGVEEGPPNIRNILPLVQTAIQVETTRLSLTSMSGQMLRNTEVATNPAVQALTLSRRLNIPVAVRSYSGEFADHYIQGNIEPTEQTLNSKIKTGFDLSDGLAITGRGVILNQVPLEHEQSVQVPEIRYSVLKVIENENLLDHDDPSYTADFKVSM
ncbi:hypothetical protein C1X35_25850 [Pseudomonas sp. FW306-1C-G01A]|uniref:hypothetical protein n=1 Tax=unclassified Pseudomonas TaxID=196821 RepID=UPI000C86E114|nr:MULTISPECIES: hypothetical protein [unclassified Pseudomonas]PMV85957.1 hypothetical protein C1X51_29635 [Pseudomonas sp. FW306-2-2C-B10A]PMV86781.1 hypothetical protein C1X56_14130 [Pseudomonas sp. GW101-1A09]PMW00622.1 hypothetical protein C1X50_28215 [Pseudomonas sp. MPR-TSA4]PMW12575.1 hypothetical protein C1X52_19170 [Pseudomonas sp. FW306-2-1A-C05A]PMW29405.1 hypothetical protein C1X48_30180 [Pseudomonas sp. FW305-3-2-15-A-R2A1]